MCSTRCSAAWKAKNLKVDKPALKTWWDQIDTWRARKCLHYRKRDDVIMPQYAIERLYALTRDKDVYITTEVGQHQMWAAQFFHFDEPNRWMTSGGLGTMGYGIPAAVGVQMAHPDSLVIDIAGEASVQMTMQEMSTAVQYDLPIKIFILNNEYMGMVRQWQELLHGGRYSHSYSEALPDFVKLAEAYQAVGIRAEKPSELDDAIKEMIATPKPVIFDCRVDKHANCFPMIPSGEAHNNMLLGDDLTDEDLREGHHRRRQGDGVMAQPGSAYSLETTVQKPETHTMSVLVDNEPGVLARVIGLFSGRGYNIEWLTVSETEHEAHLSRITIVTTGTPMVIEQIKNQLDRLVPIHSVTDLTVLGHPIERELALVKVAGKGEKRVEALRLAEAFRAQVIDASTEHFVFEITGRQSKIEQFIVLMQPLGLVEVCRTGVAAIARGPEQM